ncbi:acyltransferase [Kineobactrum salinum]|uniref:Acyltransferase n=1 Tax=Kineobactrum salinum TaxID=2708301 RepID=A0A6C0U2S2_9GAMM|nr:acyltransferase [Kineobactrum salinum]
MLAVVLFHLDVPGFDGGYVGVDVFFVISGFLITAIIERKLRNGDFSLRDFYFRRLRRLLPPVIATVAVTCAAAAVVLSPADMMAFGRSAVAALFSLSNIVFFMEAGYWDTASELKPLLHTWSLGLEEQFYLFWPALLIGLLAIDHRLRFGWSLLGIFLVGLGLCIWYTSVDSAAAFYLLPFRIFQFAAGALVIVIARSSLARPWLQRGLVRHGLAGLGLGLVCSSVLLFDDTTHFPGIAVLVPTLGAAMLLLSGSHAAQGANPVQLVLEHPISLWLGRVSYSMYLVHWPLIVLYRHQFGFELAPVDQLLLAGATLLSTALLHYGIERRFYRRVAATGTADRRRTGSRFALGVLVISGSVAAAPLTAWLGDGWSWRFPDLKLTPAQIEQGMNARYDLIHSACTILEVGQGGDCADERPLQILVLGNSHEPDGYNFLMAGYGADPDINLIRFGTTNHCDQLEFENGVPSSGSADCDRRLQRLFDPAFAARLDGIFYAANKPFSRNKQIFVDMLAHLKQTNPALRLITLGGYINTNRECASLTNEAHSTAACALPENVRYFEAAPEQEPLYAEIMALTDHYVDRVGLLCQERKLQTCLTQTSDGVPMFYDRHHHSLEFAQMTGRLYALKHPHLLR